MKEKRLIISALFTFVFYLLSSQTPQGFNYQAIARDGSGNPIASLPIQVKLAVMADSLGSTIYWEELFNPITTNAFGLFSVVLGQGVRQTTSTVSTFSSVNWKSWPLFIRTQVFYQGVWKNMGSSRLWSVPYALNANAVTGSQPYLNVTGNTAVMDSALFVVRNNKGQIIFAVYNEGVRIYVDDGIAKGSVKGGFAIGGFGTAKGVSQEYFRVTRDSTRVYVNQLAKGATKGGFAIGGFSPAKGADTSNYLNMTPNNYFIGYGAGTSNTTGLYNSFMGYHAGYSNIDGVNNSFIGYKSGSSNTSGIENVFLGNLSGTSNVDGAYNIYVGSGSGQFSPGGTYNTFIGNSSGQNFVTGAMNTFLGYGAGQAFTGGNANVFIGLGAGHGNFYGVTGTGNGNVSIGWNSGYNLNTGNNNVFLGTLTGVSNTSASDNVFIGQFSGEFTTTGSYNTFLGFNSGTKNTLGFNNTFLGIAAGYKNLVGDKNIMIGDSSGYSQTTGEGNIYIGSQAGFNDPSGQQNVFIGYKAGYSLTSGLGNIFIGPNSGGALSTASSRLFIENTSSDKTGALIYGEFDNAYLRFNANTDIIGKIGVGKTSPVTKVDITAGNWDVNTGEGDFRIGDGTYRFKIGVANSGGGAGDVRLNAHGGTNRMILGGGGKDILQITSTNIMPWTDNYSTMGGPSNRWTYIYAVNGTIQTSDIRLKTNIKNLSYGLESIMRLEPVTFTWKDEKEGKVRLGLIAQDVEKVIGEVVDKGSDPAQTLGINYSELVPVLIKGMQDQQKQIESVKQENTELKSSLKTLEYEVSILKAQVASNGNK